MGVKTELEKSLETLDLLAEDLKKSTADNAQEDVQKDEENLESASDAKDPDKEPESLNDQAKHDLEEPATAKTEGGGATEESAQEAEAQNEGTDASDGEGDKVEKGVKPDEIADEEDEEENNNSKQNNKKLMSKNSKKAEGTDETDDNPGDPREKEEQDDDEDEEEEQVGKVKKSTRDRFTDLMKSLSPGSAEEDFVDTVAKSLLYLEKSQTDTEETLSAVSQTLVKSIGAVMEAQQETQKQNASLVSLVKAQSQQIEALLGQQENFEKSVKAEVGELASQPVQRKGTVNVMEKSFSHSAGLQAEGGNLNKSEVLDKMVNMAINGDNGVTAHDVMTYESQGTMRPELESVFKQQ